MKPDWSNARSADGPTVARWVSERIPVNTVALSRDEFGEAVRSWSCPGRLIDISTLDHWLTPVGIHLCELPEDCWRWSAIQSWGKMRPLCELVVSEWTEGKGRNELARTHGVDRKMVDRWTIGIPGGLDVRECEAAA